jgi:predicted transcriptional regulator
MTRGGSRGPLPLPLNRSSQFSCTPQTVPPRPDRNAPQALRSHAGLGPLEIRLLELLWERARVASVRDLQSACPGLAYTTIMTTLDRLYRKRLLRRYRDGRAFTYEPRCTRDELLSELVSGHVIELLAASRQSGAVLSTLVRAVRDTDAALLDQLDALVQAERLRLKDRLK